MEEVTEVKRVPTSTLHVFDLFRNGEVTLDTIPLVPLPHSSLATTKEVERKVFALDPSEVQTAQTSIALWQNGSPNSRESSLL